MPAAGNARVPARSRKDFYCVDGGQTRAVRRADRDRTRAPARRSLVHRPPRVVRQRHAAHHPGQRRASSSSSRRVLNRVDRPATVTAVAAPGTTIWMGRTTPTDAQAIVGGADRTSVTGAHVRDWSLVQSRAGAGTAPALAAADIWRQTATGEGRVRMSVDQTGAPESIVIAAPDGKPVDLTSLTVTVERRTWFFQALLVTLVGLLAAVDRRRRALAAPPGATREPRRRPTEPRPTEPDDQTDAPSPGGDRHDAPTRRSPHEPLDRPHRRRRRPEPGPRRVWRRSRTGRRARRARPGDHHRADLRRDRRGDRRPASSPRPPRPAQPSPPTPQALRTEALTGSALAVANAASRLETGAPPPHRAAHAHRAAQGPRRSRAAPAWPRLILVQTATAEGGAVLNLLVSPDAKTPFRLSAAAPMQPGATVAALDSLTTGSPVVTPAAKLAVQPDAPAQGVCREPGLPQAGRRQGRRRRRPVLAADPRRTPPSRPRPSASSRPSRRRTRSSRDSTVAIALRGGGALVFGLLERTDTITPAARAASRSRRAPTSSAWCARRR